MALNRLGADGNWLYPLSDADRDPLLSVVNDLEANGGTPLGQAMKAGTDALLVARVKKIPLNFSFACGDRWRSNDAVNLERYLPDNRSTWNPIVVIVSICRKIIHWRPKSIIIAEQMMLRH